MPETQELRPRHLMQVTDGHTLEECRALFSARAWNILTAGAAHPTDTWRTPRTIGDVKAIPDKALLLRVNCGPGTLAEIRNVCNHGMVPT